MAAKPVRAVFKSAGKLGTMSAATPLAEVGIAAAFVVAVFLEPSAAVADAAAASADFLAAIASSAPWAAFVAAVAAAFAIAAYATLK